MNILKTHMEKRTMQEKTIPSETMKEHSIVIFGIMLVHVPLNPKMEDPVNLSTKLLQFVALMVAVIESFACIPIKSRMGLF